MTLTIVYKIKRKPIRIITSYCRENFKLIRHVSTGNFRSASKFQGNFKISSKLQGNYKEISKTLKFQGNYKEISKYIENFL